MADTIVGSETWEVRFRDGARSPVCVDHHRNTEGEWYYAHAPWPGIPYKLHMSGNTAAYAVERLIVAGVSNAEDEDGCGLREVLSPADLAAEGCARG